MARALIVLDAQKGMLQAADFGTQLAHIDQLMDEFNEKDELIVATKHLDDMKGSLIEQGTEGAEVDQTIASKSTVIMEKKSPNSFLGTNLQELLTEYEVEELLVTGFNSEYCCLFTSIAGVDRGYDVIVIEDAIGTVNEGEIYDYEDLDITDFIGSILHYSGDIDVLDYDEYKEGDTDEDEATEDH